MRMKKACVGGKFNLSKLAGQPIFLWIMGGVLEFTFPVVKLTDFGNRLDAGIAGRRFLNRVSFRRILFFLHIALKNDKELE